MLQVLVLGQPGEEFRLELILRVVADVGLVVCFGSPERFTTYIPQLCILQQ